MTRSLTTALVLMFCPALAAPQSFNVDLGTEFGPPADTFGAAGDQAGVWNTLGLGSSALVDLSGAATGVSVDVSSFVDIGSAGSGSNDAELLFGDNTFDCVDPDQWSVTFSGLQNGPYVVSLCAPLNTSVSTGDMLMNGQAVASIPGDSASLILGQTYVTVPVNVTAGTLDLSGDATSIDNCAGLAGVQLTPVASFTPAALAVDPPGLAPEANGVFEPGEAVDVVPAWRNNSNLATSLGGTASSFTGPAGAAYDIDLDAADYGLILSGDTASCLDTEVCYRLALDDPAVRPATLWEATFDETLNDLDGTTKTWTLHIGRSFDDVPPTNPFYPAIETLLRGGITGGCAAGAYCPGEATTRSQMPAFLLRALEGADYRPPACAEGNEPFDDVPFDSPFCPWIQELANRGIVAGCGGGDYCPGAPVTRAQMAIFLIRTVAGNGYTPPACASRFADVPCPSLFADWIEDLAARDITSGCSTTHYCPGDPVSRAQMAAFVTHTFGLTLHAP